MRIRLLVLLLIIIKSIVHGQGTDNHLMSLTKMDPLSYEILMHEWSQNPNLENLKGWKWIGRWICDQQRLSMPGGTPVDRKTYSDGLTDYQNHKKAIKHSSVARSIPWSPAGPLVAPTPVNSQLVTGTGRINCITFHPTDPNIMWCGGGQGGIFKSTNRGESWFPIGDQLPVMHVSDIAVDPNNADILYTCVGDYAYVGTGLYLDNRKRYTHFGLGIYKSLDGGATWNPTGLSFQQSQQDETLMRRVLIDSNNSAHLVSAGISGIYQSFDAGASWTKMIDEVIWDFEQDPVQPNIIYASTGFIPTRYIGNAGLLKSVDFGQTWVSLPLSVPPRDSVTRIEIGISRSNPDYLYALTANLRGGFAGLHRSTDGGLNWEVRSTFPNILHWHTGSFSSTGQGWYDLAILVDPGQPDKIYTGGINSWVSEDGGITWNGASYYHGSYGGVAVHADHHQLKYNPWDQKIYLCHDGGISRTDEIIPGDWHQALSDTSYLWPTLWEHLNNGLSNLSFYRLGLSHSQPGDIYAGAQDMGTFLRDGEFWTYHTLGDGMECIIHPQNDQILYGSSQYGSLYISHDRGLNYTSLGGFPRPWESEFSGWTTPFALFPDDPSSIYVGAENMWYSPDDGISFIPISGFANRAPISDFGFCETDPSAIMVAKRLYSSWGQLSEMYYTSDFGTTWENVTAGLPDSLYFSYVDVDDNDPQHAWVACSGFSAGKKVFETQDGGKNWINISGTLPNLPANCILHQTGSITNIIYIGMDRGVYYRTDEMEEWALLAEGLPNVVVSEIELLQNGQNGIPELYISTFGRGVWKTDALTDVAVSSNSLYAMEVAARMFPTINHGEFNIELNKIPVSEKGQLIITDVHGRTIYTESFQSTAQSFLKEMKIRTLSGQYYLNIRIGNYRTVIPFLIID